MRGRRAYRVRVARHAGLKINTCRERGGYPRSLCNEMTASGSAFLSCGIIYHNQAFGAAYNGGGVYVDGTFDMTNGSLRYNSAGNCGDSVYVGAGGMFTMEGGRIYDNSSYLTGSRGDGIYAEGKATVTNGYLEGVIAGGENLAVTGGYFASGDTDAQTVGGYAIDAEKYIVVQLGNLGYTMDSYYVSDFPFALYNRGTTQITFEKAEKIVYDGSSIRNREDFTFTYSYTGTGDTGTSSYIYYSSTPDGEFIDSNAQFQSLPRNAGTWYLKARASSEYYSETRTYYPVTESEVYSIVIEKAPAPIPEVPAGLELTYGETLADVALPSGWTWGDKSVSVGNAGERSFAATFTPEDTRNYNTAQAELTVAVGKAVYDMSGIAFEDMTVTYDGTAQSLAIVGNLPGGVTVSYFENNQVNAGTYEITAKFTGDTANYEDIPDMTATLTINKATPDYTVPDGLTATEGQSLADIALPEGWSWADSSFSVGEEGERTFAAVYTPVDTGNYNTVEIELTVSISAAGLPVGAIVGIVLGCVFGLLLIAYGAGAFLYKKGKIGGRFFETVYPFIKM